MVAREDAQMVARLVFQADVVVCVESHEYGGATAKEDQRFEEITWHHFRSVPFSLHATVDQIQELDTTRVR